MSLLGGRYRLGSRLAVGGMGEVWEGTDAVLDRPVAIKLLREEYRQHAETLGRFRAEARHVASLSHPGIAQIYDYREDDPPNPPYLVMELVRGSSLAGKLADGPLDTAFAMDVIAQTAAALHAAHAAGVVHRDIKPGNLLLSPDGQVKITDFGIASAAGAAPVTRTGMLIGTASYVAPERIAGASATPAADLYALGIVAYECLAGVPPFRGDSLEVMFAHRERPLPPLPPGIPGQIVSFVTELTAKDPAARPADAGEVAARARGLMDQAAATDGGPATGAATAVETGFPARRGVSCPAGLPTRLSLLPAGGSGWRHRGIARSPRAALAIAGIVMTSVAGWLLATTLGPTPAGRAKEVQGMVRPATAPRPATRSPAVDRMVDINGAALAGQPVSRVSDQLEALGLVVRVHWRQGGHRAPGTVVSALPTGQVPVGSVVVLVGAAGGHAHGGKHAHGRGGGHGGESGLGDTLDA